MSSQYYTSSNWSQDYDETNMASSSTFDPLEEQDKEKPKAMSIQVMEPKKDIDHVTYQVMTKTSLETFKPTNVVQRRFRDFVWLFNALTGEFPTCVIPPLPEKHRLNYVNGGRFDPAFIEHRRLGLQWFMDRISNHPLLQKSSSTRMFLESVDFNSDKTVIQSKPKPTLFGSFFFKTAKVKKPDQKFEDMKGTVNKFEDNLTTIERLYLRIGKRQQELEQNYDGFAASLQGLSILEQEMDKPLKKFAEATDTYAKSLKEMRQQQNVLFLNDVHELINYCNAAKVQLDTRDQKQVDFEELSSNLQSLTAERERLLDPSKAHSNMGIAEFMADKMNDTGRGKSERIIRLEVKISQLQEQVTRANDDNQHYSEQMLKEYKIFQKTGQKELKQGLASYADCHIDYYKKGLSIWENILPILNEM